MRIESARALKQEWKNTGVAFAASVAALEANENPEPTSIVAVGIAHAGGNEYQLAIRARKENAAAVREIERARAMAAGEIDVKFTGAITARPGAVVAAATPLAIGASVGHFSSTAGTLCCFAKNAAGGLGFISNNHVLAFEDRGNDGDAILHPGPVDGGTTANDVVAKLVAPYPLLHPGIPKVDCAFALLEPGITFDGLALTGGNRLDPRPAFIQNRAAVEKIGRTTGRTSGIVSAFELENLVVDYSSGLEVTFADQIEIESASSGLFADAGDSGSIVFDAFFQPIGVVFATATARGLTYANPLQTVLDALGVELLT